MRGSTGLYMLEVFKCCQGCAESETKSRVLRHARYLVCNAKRRTSTSLAGSYVESENLFIGSCLFWRVKQLVIYLAAPACSPVQMPRLLARTKCDKK